MVTALHAQEINWQEAVARVARERTLAETCAGLLKNYGDKAAQARGATAYGEARPNDDEVIAGLVVAVARKEQPESLPDLQVRLRTADVGVELLRREDDGTWPATPMSPGRMREGPSASVAGQRAGMTRGDDVVRSTSARSA